MKLQGAGGCTVVRGDKGAAAGRLLLDAAAKLAGKPAEKIQLMAGFPPQRLVAEPHLDLQALGLSSGDTVLVRELSAKEVSSLPPDPNDAFLPEIGYRGLLMKRVVPSDNSCLFTSVGEHIHNLKRNRASRTL